MTHDTTALHVILGAGQIGGRLAADLLAAGHRVRLVRRGQAGPPRPGLEQVSCDVTDLPSAEAAMGGASVVYDCMNPPYDRWPELLLPIARGALHGASRAGARLVALDCLYMYGKPDGPMREDTPMNPCSKKGALRAALASERLEAHRRGDVKVAIGRASDFFGSGLPYAVWSERFFRRVYAGKAGECTGDPDMPHSYTYANDVARALATLGASETALGQVWHLPTPKAESTRALAARLGLALHRPISMTGVPKLALRALGLFSPTMREMVEMTYQWEVPYVLDDSKFRGAFDYGPTPLDEAVAETAHWARATFGHSAAA